MSNGGRGDNRGNHRRPFRYRERENNQPAYQYPQNRKADNSRPEENSRNREALSPRMQWVPPKLSTEPFPVPNCPYCGKPVKDLSLAISDRDSGDIIHFDCIIARISKGENLEPGDTICYIGGGRFGVVHFNDPSRLQEFSIKRIYEWENKDNRADWRQAVSDHYSIT